MSLAKKSPIGLRGQELRALRQRPNLRTIDGSGNLYAADTDDNNIRKIDIASGVVTTLAGGGGIDKTNYGQTDATGTAAKFDYPSAVAIDGSGNLYVADSDNIRMIVIASRVVSTLAGGGSDGKSPGQAEDTGTAATFNGPSGVGMDSSGNLYVLETFNKKIRKITKK